MAAPCVSTFVDGNEAITRTRDLEVPHQISQHFYICLEGLKFFIQYTFGSIHRLSL